MKTFIAVVITAVLTWVAAGLYHGLWTSTDRMWMFSAIKAPGEMAIRDVQKDMDAGRYALAKKKLDAFMNTWRRFMTGPDSCSGAGIGDIMVAFSRIPDDIPATNVESRVEANGSQPIRSETTLPSGAAGSRR